MKNSHLRMYLKSKIRFLISCLNVFYRLLSISGQLQVAGNLKLFVRPKLGSKYRVLKLHRKINFFLDVFRTASSLLHLTRFLLSVSAEFILRVLVLTTISDVMIVVVFISKTENLDLFYCRGTWINWYLLS